MNIASPIWEPSPGMAVWRAGVLYEAGEFLQVQDYKNVQRWTQGRSTIVRRSNAA